MVNKYNRKTIIDHIAIDEQQQPTSSNYASNIAAAHIDDQMRLSMICKYRHHSTSPQSSQSFPIIRIALIVLLLFVASSSSNTTEAAGIRRGCHKVGKYNRFLCSDIQISIAGFEHYIDEPGCDLVAIAVNKCTGYCLSFAFPSSSHTDDDGGSQRKITVRGKCCRMIETQWVR